MAGTLVLGVGLPWAFDPGGRLGEEPGAGHIFFWHLSGLGLFFLCPCTQPALKPPQRMCPLSQPSIPRGARGSLHCQNTASPGAPVPPSNTCAGVQKQRNPSAAIPERENPSCFTAGEKMALRVNRRKENVSVFCKDQRVWLKHQ